MPFRPAFYAHLIVLQAGLIWRVVADLSFNWPLRQWGGLLNVIAILLFLANTLLSIRRAE
jgi:hypothetical protein